MLKTLGLALTLLVGAAGCTSWRFVPPGHQPVPTTVRATLRDGSTSLVINARLAFDTLLVGDGPQGRDVAIRVEEISYLMVRRIDVTKTVVFAGFTALVVLPVAFVLYWGAVSWAGS